MIQEDLLKKVLPRYVQEKEREWLHQVQQKKTQAVTAQLKEPVLLEEGLTLVKVVLVNLAKRMERPNSSEVLHPPSETS